MNQISRSSATSKLMDELLNKESGKIKGPGIPDGTGPSQECPLKNDTEKISETKVFKNKKELVDWVKKMVNTELSNEKNGILNKKRNFLYTEISQQDGYNVFHLLNKYNIKYEKHMKDNYWIRIK